MSTQDEVDLTAEADPLFSHPDEHVLLLFLPEPPSPAVAVFRSVGRVGPTIIVQLLVSPE
jgi:hypothetical protein